MLDVISVLLVDDHTLLRKGLRLLLEDDPEVCVVGEASNGFEAVQLVRKLAPRVVVMDLAMPLMDGMEATRQILEFAPETAVLMLSMSSEDNFVRKAFAAGVRGYLVKSAFLDIARMVKDAAQGRCVMDGADPRLKLR
jgi:DNA-binding NarL/FixJ family response regulator